MCKLFPKKRRKSEPENYRESRWAHMAYDVFFQLNILGMTIKFPYFILSKGKGKTMKDGSSSSRGWRKA